ncbi:MAG: hypothetical protein HZB56_20130 [Deltaproteobacteria bacterium]|nr:hypothetical protein [Deltaproteobacteria bacterium]
MRRAVLLLLVGAGACGYGFGAGVSRLPPGAEAVRVRPLDNRSPDAEAGALLAAALRRELARRGAEGVAGATAELEGEVEESGTAPIAAGASAWRLTLVARVRLRTAEKTLGEARVRRSEDYVAGVDALESEGRRRIALSRAADGAARELLERLARP